MLPAPWNETPVAGKAMGRLAAMLAWGLLAVLAGRAGLGSAVHAHGAGEPVLAHEPVDPYILYVWIEPWPAVTGEMHVTVSVNEPWPGKPGQTHPVLQADVTLRAQPADQEAEAVRARATHKQAVNKLFYEGRLFLATPGPWTLHLDIDSELGRAAHAWTVDVGGDRQPPREGGGRRIMNWFRQLFRRG